MKLFMRQLPMVCKKCTSLVTKKIFFLLNTFDGILFTKHYLLYELF